MENKYKLLIKNTGYLTISNFASKILVFLLVPLYTSYLTTEEYGKYDAIVITVQIIAPLVIANISEGVMRFLLDDNNDEDVITIGNRFILMGIFIMGVLFTINRLTNAVSFINGYEIYGFLYSAFYITNNYLTQFAKGQNRVRLMAITGALSTVVMLIGNIAFLILFKMGIIGFLLANIMSLAIPTLVYLMCLKPWNANEKSPEYYTKRREMLNYSFPLVFNAIGWTINSSLDKYCVIYFYGVAASGLLAIAYKIPTILSVLYSVFTQAWQISAVQEYGKDDSIAFYSGIVLVTNAIGCMGCSALLLFNRILAGFLFSNEFYQAWQYVPFLLLSVLLNQTAGVIGPILSAKKESKAMAIASVAGAISNLFFNIILIKIMGIQGAALATALSSFIILFIRWWHARDLLNSNIYLTICSSWIVLSANAVFEIASSSYIFHVAAFMIITAINFKQIKNAIKQVFHSK